MELDQTLILNVLIVAIAATVVLIILAMVVPRLRRDRPATPFVAPSAPTMEAAALGRPVMAGAGAGAASATMFEPRQFITAPRPQETSAGAAPTPAESNGTDALTGLILLGTWNRILADEDARVRRYRRPATVVMLDIDGLDRLIERLGPEAGERLIPAVAGTIRRNARSADQVARLGLGRFGVLLPETDEVQAINYVERVRRACDLWLEAGAVSVRLAIGWASTSGEEGLPDAQRVAGERMFAEVHRHARRSGEMTGDLGPGQAGRGGEASRGGETGPGAPGTARPY
jgi:diguanylate cyclase (GGDEF)-like protein